MRDAEGTETGAKTDTAVRIGIMYINIARVVTTRRFSPRAATGWDPGIGDLFAGFGTSAAAPNHPRR